MLDFGLVIERDTRAAPRESLPIDYQFKQIGLYIDVYKQHLDLFLKATVVYLAVIAGIAGYAFREGVSTGSQAALSGFAVAMSLIGAFVCRVGRGWVDDLAAIFNRLADDIGAAHFPFSGARRGTVAVEAICVAFALIAALNLIAVLR
jgi:hypothetical protein